MLVRSDGWTFGPYDYFLWRRQGSGGAHWRRVFGEGVAMNHWGLRVC